MEHFEGVNNQERYNNDLLNEIRKTNQLLEQLISYKPIQPKTTGSDKSAKNRQQQARGNRSNTK